MRWYNGSIAEAVSLSKQRNAIFVVFVEGNNDQSAKMASTIEEEAVLSRLDNDANFLAVKLQSGTTNYTHFAQIYQLVPVPSLFFIGRNGAPLEVVCADIQPTSLADRIDRILEQHRKDNLAQPSPSQNLKQATSSLLQSETQAAPSTSSASRTVDVEPETSSGPSHKVQKTEDKEFSSSKDYDVVCKDDVCVRVPKKTEDPGPSGAAVADPEPTQNESYDVAAMEEKVKKAKELIEARRREKADQEKELERQKELERRAMGQGIAELKRKQADEELRQIQEERKREKLENNLARQRILEQIAQDRAERKARDAPSTPVPVTTEPSVPRDTGDASGRARIQFKLPDGSAHTALFASNDCVAAVKSYVADNLQLSQSNYSLWTAFPRRELTEPEATLRDLQLAPSGALLVLPRRQATQVTSPSQFAKIVALISQLFTTMIWDPTQQLFNWLTGRAAPPPERPPSREASGTQRPQTREAPGTQKPQARYRSNIRSLNGERSPDDDNNTWNGT